MPKKQVDLNPASPGELPTLPLIVSTEPEAPVPPVPGAAPAQLITLDLSQLTSLIAGVIGQQKGPDVSGLGEAIADGISKSTRRKMSYAEYIVTRGSYYHPDPKKSLKLTRQCFQNGGEIHSANIHDAEVDLLNRITHSGRYIDRLVEVSVREEGGGTQTVHLIYNNKAAGAQAIYQKLLRKPEDKTTLHTMLRMIVEEQVIEDREQELRLEEKNRLRLLAQSSV